MKNKKTMETKKNELIYKVMRAIAPITEDILKDTDGGYLVQIANSQKWSEGFYLLILGYSTDKYRLLKKVGRYGLYIVNHTMYIENKQLVNTADTPVGCWIENQLELNQVDGLEITTYYI